MDERLCAYAPKINNEAGAVPGTILPRCLGHGEKSMDYSKPANLLTPVRAIRAKCLDCAGGVEDNVEACTLRSCPLWGGRSDR